MAEGTVKQPLVSVIIPAYNVGEYITDTVNSVLNQTYNNIEIIVIDDHSTDDTLKKLGAINATKPLYIIDKEINAGAAAARNTGYQASKGDYIKFLDGDDLINPESIEQQVILAQQNKNCIISGKWGRFIGNNIDTFKLNPEGCWQSLHPVEWIYCAWEYVQPMTNPGIFLIPRSLINKAGPWDETLSLLDDTEYFARTILSSNKVFFCDGAILYYRSGINNSLSGTHSRKAIESAFNALDKTTLYFSNNADTTNMQLLCANIWQSFIYWIYPNNLDIIKKAETKKHACGKATLVYKAEGLSKILQNFLGWKFLKRIKYGLKVKSYT